jgi:hypothetical protein
MKMQRSAAGLERDRTDIVADAVVADVGVGMDGAEGIEELAEEEGEAGGSGEEEVEIADAPVAAAGRPRPRTPSAVSFKARWRSATPAMLAS